MSRRAPVAGEVGAAEYYGATGENCLPGAESHHGLGGPVPAPAEGEVPVTRVESPYRVYVYTEPGKYEEGDRVVKIGQTATGDSLARIWAQYPTAKPGDRPFILLADFEAVNRNGNRITDKAVHAFLRDAGFQQLRGASKSGDDKRRQTEWFRCSVEDVENAMLSLRDGRRYEPSRHLAYQMRPEQRRAVEITSRYFAANPRSQAGEAPPRFLWNAKMRFGKTFTAFQIAKHMGWTRVMVLTYKPAVENEWYQEIASHIDFDGWQMISRGRMDYEQADQSKPIVWFASFQDIMGRDRETGEGKQRFEAARAIEWDAVILDEYHFGAHRDGARVVYDPSFAEESEDPTADPEDLEAVRDLAAITPEVGVVPLDTRHLLYLSGTPFRALKSGEFSEDQIFTWSYADEQAAKAAASARGGYNPYADLPQMQLITYELSPELRSVAAQGMDNEFSLNEFFRAVRPEGAGPDDDPVFLYEEHVLSFLEFLVGNTTTSHFAADGTRIEAYPPIAAKVGADHTFWFLPNVPACRAMRRLLERHRAYAGYQIILAAGDEAGMGAKAKHPVVEAIGEALRPGADKRRTITLSCMKLTTGVTIKQWSAVIVLRDISSPETYFQTAFRAQSPWSERDPEEPTAQKIMKQSCFVYDFSPQRALNIVFEYCVNNNRGGKRIGDAIGELLHFMPVIAISDGIRQVIQPDEIWEYATVGVGATMIAKRWQSPLIVNVSDEALTRLMDDPQTIEAIGGIEQFRALKRDLGDDLRHIVSESKALKAPDREGRTPTPEEAKRKDVNRKAKKELREKLIKFLTRIPHFMYLTDFREEAIEDVIRRLDTDLFRRVTGLGVDDFDRMVQIGLFNRAHINQAIIAFRRFETDSLNYVGGGFVHQRFGGFDTALRLDEVDDVLGVSRDIRYAIKSVGTDRIGRPARDTVQALFDAGRFAFSANERLLRRYGPGTRIALYEKGVGVIAWIELAGRPRPGYVAKRVIADPDLYPIDAPIQSCGLVDPPFVLTDHARASLDWFALQPDVQWSALVHGPKMITERDFVTLTRQNTAGDEGTGEQ